MADGSFGGLPSTLPGRIQARLTRYYGIEDAPAVDDFVEPADGAREALLVREADGELHLSVRLPRALAEGGRPASFDEACQVVEGVSHFVYLAERARRELPATQLELELQAEIDKYLVFAHGARPFCPRRAARLRERLFDRTPRRAIATGWRTISPRASPAGWRRASRGTGASIRCARG